VVWDFDEVLKAICGDTHGEVPPGAMDLMLSMRRAFLAVLCDQTYVRPPHSVWIIEGAPRRMQRQNRAESLGAEIIVLNTAKDECLRRAAPRDRNYSPAIEKWFKEYEP
jgi:hypothetical protein